MARVFIVEDDVDLRDTYVDILEADGHQTDTAGSACEALHYLARAHRPAADLVILDMQLPGDSGILVLSFIRRFSRLAHTKVVVASGHPELAKKAVDQWGADMFLCKPISSSDLQDALKKLLKVNL